MRRPSYQHGRRLVRIEVGGGSWRRAAGPPSISGGPPTLAAGRVPSAVLVLEQLRDLRGAEELVIQEHKGVSALAQARRRGSSMSRGSAAATSSIAISTSGDAPARVRRPSTGRSRRRGYGRAAPPPTGS